MNIPISSENYVPENIIREFKSLINHTNRVSRVIDFIWEHNIPYKDITAEEIEIIMSKRWEFKWKYEIIQIWLKEVKWKITEDTLILLLDNIDANYEYLQAVYQLYINNKINDKLFLGKYHYLNNESLVAKRYIKEIQSLDISNRNSDTKNSMKALYILLMIHESEIDTFIAQITNWDKKIEKLIKKSVNQLKSNKKYTPNIDPTRTNVNKRSTWRSGTIWFRRFSWTNL